MTASYQHGKYDKVDLFGVHYSIADYESAVQIIRSNALKRVSYGVSALAVHGLMTAARDSNFRSLVNRIDMVVPDGQPVRWALNSLYRCGLADRVYGPELTIRVLAMAEENHLKVFLYGSTERTLNMLIRSINKRFPRLVICGNHVDRFRDATKHEDEMDVKEINASGAHIVLVGRGCPRQEVWVANHIGTVNAVMIAVGAAFDFIAGTVRQAPKWMQKNGLEWLYRVFQEPRRLWRRYLVTNSQFIWYFLKHRFILRKSL